MATGVIESDMSAGSTGFHSQTNEHLKNFYDIQAWIPKNAVLAKMKSLSALDAPAQAAVLNVAADTETRGWKVAGALRALCIFLIFVLLIEAGVGHHPARQEPVFSRLGVQRLLGAGGVAVFYLNGRYAHQLHVHIHPGRGRDFDQNHGVYRHSP